MGCIKVVIPRSLNTSLTSSRRRTPLRFGGGFQVGRLARSRFFASDISPAPRGGCPPPLFYSLRAITVPVNYQIALRAAVDPSRKRDPVSMAAARAFL